MVIAIVVFGVIALVFLASVIRSFTSRGDHASQKAEYKKTEIFWTSLVGATMVFLVTFSLSHNTSSHAKPDMTVHVTAFQWCWRFGYPGTGVSVTADCVNGQLPTLVVPTGEDIRFQVVSSDVIHSMWVPYLRFKMFAYPDWTNTFQTTFRQTGTWDGECTEFCGQYHYAMHFHLHAVTKAQFRSWLKSQEAPK